MLPNFVYLPAEPNKDGRWINLSLVADINQRPGGKLFLWGASGEEIAELSGEQAKLLQSALAGLTRPFPSGGVSDSDYFDRHTERREPQLPNLPDPVIIPPAVREFDEKVSARGVVV